VACSTSTGELHERVCAPFALLGGRDGRLLLVAVGAVLGAPVAALAAVMATSALSLGLRVAFLRRPPAHNVGSWS
jgi:hypothetical protein